MLASVVENMKTLVAEVSKSYNKESVKAQLDLMFNNIPDKYVKIGESWIAKGKVSSMDMNLDNTYTLLSVEKDNYVIGLKGNVSTDKTKKTKINGMETTADLKGTMEGKTYLSKKTAWIVSVENKTKVNGTLNIDVNGNPMEVNMDLQVDSSSKD